MINSLHVSFLQNYGKLKNNQRKIQAIIIILTMHPLKNRWCILSIQKISLVTISLFFTLHDLKFQENYAIHQFKACWNVTEQTVNTRSHSKMVRASTRLQWSNNSNNAWFILIYGFNFDLFYIYSLCDVVCWYIWMKISTYVLSRFRFKHSDPVFF